jgi:hypothetical protein
MLIKSNHSFSGGEKNLSVPASYLHTVNFYLPSVFSLLVNAISNYFTLRPMYNKCHECHN